MCIRHKRAQQLAAGEATRSSVQFNNAVEESGPRPFESAANPRHAFWRDRTAKHLGSAGPSVAVETVWLKYFEVLSESLVQVAQRIENGSDPGLQLRIFVREHCVITLTVQHCRLVPSQTYEETK